MLKSKILRRCFRRCWFCPMPSYGSPFLSVVDYPRPTFTNLVHAFTQSTSSFPSTCPCHLSLPLLITSPVAYVPRCLLSSPNIHLIILTFHLRLQLCSHVSHTHSKQLLLHAEHTWPFILIIYGALEIKEGGQLVNFDHAHLTHAFNGLPFVLSILQQLVCDH